MKENFDVAIATGFIGSKGMRPAKAAIDEVIQPETSRIIPSAPLHKAFHHPNSVVDAVGKELDAMESDNIVLIGHSYGALMALVAACRRELKDISKLFLIDGPINNEIPIKPARPEHYLFWRHYQHREELAAECEEALRKLDVSKIVTIASQHDRIVPPRSKQLHGNFQEVEMVTEDDIDPLIFEVPYGTNVYLPEHYKGHSINKRIAIVASIIRSAMQQVEWMRSAA